MYKNRATDKRLTIDEKRNIEQDYRRENDY